MNFFSSLYLSNTFYYIAVQEKQFADGSHTIIYSLRFYCIPSRSTITPTQAHPDSILCSGASQLKYAEQLPNSDGSLEIPDRFICMCSALLLDENSLCDLKHKHGFLAGLQKSGWRHFWMGRGFKALEVARLPSSPSEYCLGSPRCTTATEPQISVAKWSIC